MNDRLPGPLNRLRQTASSSATNAGIAAMVVLLFLIIIWWQVHDWYREQLISETRSQVFAEVSVRSSALNSAVNRRLARLQSLRAFVETEYAEPDFSAKFDTYAAALYIDAQGVRNFALAPDSVMRYVYPRAGNEAVLGYMPLEDARPNVRADAERVVSTHDVVLTGPIELVQGGQGLIAWQSVNIGGSYWGLVDIVMDVPSLLMEAGLSDNNNLAFALRDTDGHLIHGSNAIFQNDPVVSLISLPDNDWVLAAVPQAGWLAAVQRSLRVFQIAGITIIALLTIVTYGLVDRQSRLTLAVQQRTRELSRLNQQLQHDIAERERAEAALREREEQYRSVFESTTDALFINDFETRRLVDFNPTAHKMHGYTAEEFAKLQPEDFIHPDYLHIFDEYVEVVKRGGEYRARAVDVRKDGTPFYVEVLGTAFTYRGKPHTLAVVRDVDEQVKAYELLEQSVQERTRELVTLLEISRNVASTLELEPLLGLILEQLKEVVDYSGGAILSVDGESLRVRAHRGMPLDEQTRRRYPGLGELVEHIVHQRKPVVIPDVQDDSQLARALRGSAQRDSEEPGVLGSWLGVPLTVRDEVKGMLALFHNERNSYSAATAEVLLAFANQAAVALENARLYEEAKGAAALKERQKLARELHDSVSQALYGIALGARTARTLLDRMLDGDTAPRPLAEPLDYILSLAEAGLAEMRALIFELRPESLEMEGLVAALTKQAAALEARHRLAVSTVLCEEPEAPLAVKETVYRVAQEALHNVVKHARATRVEVRLGCHDGELSLDIADDGQGFETDGSFPGHLGLRSMRERVEGAGGQLIVSSRPGAGTRVSVRMPLPAPSAAHTPAV